MRLDSIPAVLAVAFLLGSCSPAAGPPVTKQTSSEQPCSRSILQIGPAGFPPYGLARAGPLWFSAFGHVDAGSPATLASGGGPYDGWKVLIHPDPKAAGIVSLWGNQCSTGAVVRFCYSTAGCDWASRAQSSLSTMYVDVSTHLDYTGYMVFPGPGLMRLTVSDLHGVVGTVVIEVPQVPIQ